MYGRTVETSENFIREKFARKLDVAEANVLALRAGWNYGETTEAFATTYEVARAKLAPGSIGRFPGNTALSASSPRANCRRAGGAAAPRSPRRRTSCTSCPGTRTSMC